MIKISFRLCKICFVYILKGLWKFIHCFWNLFHSNSFGLFILHPSIIRRIITRVSRLMALFILLDFPEDYKNHFNYFRIILQIICINWPLQDLRKIVLRIILWFLFNNLLNHIISSHVFLIWFLIFVLNII